jgi:peptidoglycan/LPS O-acetylase OafA/YrhL
MPDDPPPSSEQSPQTHDRSISTLDGWRALAVLWVCAFHGTSVLFQPQGILPNRFVQSVAAQGELGVEIFFGLSGFLITSLLVREKEKDGGISLAAFYRRRAFRIFPAAWFYLAVIAFLAAINLIPKLAPSEITSSLFFWRNYSGPGRATSHYWSLSVEEHFYFLWPALFFFVSDKKKLLKYALAGAIAVAIWRVVDGRYNFAHRVFPFIPSWPFRTDLKIDAILWGCIVALLLPLLREFFAKFNPLGVQLCAAGIASVFALLRFFGIPFADMCLAAAIPVMIAATSSAPSTILSRILDLAPLRFIGRISFSLYLWQQLFFYVWAHEYPHTDGYGQFGWGLVLGTLLCAIASYHFVEQPMIALGRRFARKQRGPTLARA